MNGQIKTLNSGSKVLVLKQDGNVIKCKRIRETANGFEVESGSAMRLPADCFKN
jgi:hypothetical protein